MKTNGGFYISQIKQIQARIFDQLLRNAGIDDFSGAQGRILYVLWSEDDLPITELAKRTGLAKPTLTSMLDRLEKSCVLRRVPDPNDRRQIRIKLTDAAWALSSKYDLVSDQMVDIFYNGFTEEEIAAFEATLIRIIDNLKEKECSI